MGGQRGTVPFKILGGGDGAAYTPKISEILNEI